MIKKNKSPWNKDKRLSKKHKENISSSMKGKHNSPNTEFKKGQKNYWTGKKNLELSKRQKGKSNPMFGKIPWNKNKCHSEETKEKIRKAHILRGTKPPVQHLKGKESPSWKGGITPENNKIRNGTDISNWKKKVFKRDDYTCQKTKIKGGKLCCHHILNFAEYPDLRCKISNGITFLEEIHKEFHKIYGRKNNTKEQLIEFLN